MATQGAAQVGSVQLPPYMAVSVGSPTTTAPTPALAAVQELMELPAPQQKPKVWLPPWEALLQRKLKLWPVSKPQHLTQNPGSGYKFLPAVLLWLQWFSLSSTLTLSLQEVGGKLEATLLEAIPTTLKVAEVSIRDATFSLVETAAPSVEMEHLYAPICW